MFIDGRFNVVNELETLRRYATNYNPPIKPLIVNTSYFVKIVSLYKHYGLFIYYAYYGRGKTYGVGYKLYHESHPRYGYYKEEFNTIFVNAREALAPFDSPIYKFISSIKGIGDPISPLIAGILYAGLNPNVINQIGSPKIMSTFLLQDNKITSKLRGIPISAQELAKRKWDYVIDLVREINKITKKNAVIVIDEVEYWITERFYQPFRRFAADLAKKIRSYNELVGVIDLKVVLLVQKAVINETEINNLKKELDENPHLKAAKGITHIDEMQNYNIDIYLDYIDESLSRLYEKTHEYQYESLRELVNRYKSSIRKSLNFIENVPPRIAFSIVDRFIQALTRQKIYKGMPLKKEVLDNALKELLDELKTAGSIWRLYSILVAKPTILSDSDIRKGALDIINYISQLIPRDFDYEPVKIGQSYIIKYLYRLESSKRKKEDVPILDINTIIFRASINPPKNLIKDSKKIASNIIDVIYNELIRYYYERKTLPTRVNIILYPLIYKKAKDLGQLTRLFSFINSQLTHMEKELKSKLKETVVTNENIPEDQVNNLNYNVKLNNPFLIDDDGIIVAYLLSRKASIEPELEDYINNRNKELLNEIRERWKI